MYRYFLITGLCFISISSLVANECRVVTALDNNPWEEGLGVFGDPSVDGDSQTVTFSQASVTVGQNRWELSDGDKITRKSGARRSVSYHVQPKDGGNAITVVVYPSERGVVLYHENGKSTAVATFDCSSVETVEKASLKANNVKVVSKAPKSVQQNVDKVDLPIELGDGYYDIKETKLHVVYKKAGTKVVAGYLLWAKLYYTQDNEDIEVLVRFDRNGLRLGEIEHL